VVRVPVRIIATREKATSSSFGKRHAKKRIAATSPE
jgi:hypothetical protein